ncbi:MAG: thioredoxin family protein, partial [Gemmatimonadota bacterium]|nr:thioredoxin family protein [Gemmatimonadota bacterium]
ARLPRPADAWTARAWTVDGGYVMEVAPAAGAPSAGAPAGAATPASLPAPYLFVDSTMVIEHPQPQRVSRTGESIRIFLPRSEFALEPAERLGGILVAELGAATGAAWVVETAVGPAPADPALAANAIETGGLAAAHAAAATTESAAGGMGIPLALLFAFLGGLLLNLMPCVFPVLSVKVLGFVEHGGGSAAGARRHGLAFAAGVVGSFLLLAGLLLALRAGGESLGWGFQLQSPVIVAALALLLFLLGLNLSGLFEVGAGLTRLGAIGGGRGTRDALLTGGLTVLVASPCTAPFMGAALGFALVQPPAAGLAVFTALGLGLAAPYVVLSFSPALLRRLPRPGPWMVTLRQALAFPLYATVAWLVWVFGRQAGIDATGLLLLALTLVAFGAWGLGRAAPARRPALARAGRFASVVLLLAGTAVALQGARAARPPSAEAAVPAGGWEAWSPDRVAELRAEGRPVFLDFTAAWCLSCQVNERVALATEPVRTAFADADVALLKADWTNRDPRITAALASFGRSGVPLYVLYPAGGTGDPDILPAVLTPGLVVAAVERAARSGEKAARE